MDKIDQWHQKRRGKFTASECHKLYLSGSSISKGNKEAKNSMFSPGGWTYIKSKAIEMTTKFWERPEIDEVDSILHGRAHEYPAYAEYVRVTRNDSLIYMGDENPIFIPHPILVDEFGGTPDCAVINDDGTIPFGVEIKCPKNPEKHWDRLDWTSQWDLKENYMLCYAQIQALMMCTGAKEWHFVSYDERQILKAARIKIIEVKPDNPFQSTLEIRIKQAINEKYRMISEKLKSYGISVANRQEFNEKFHIAA